LGGEENFTEKQKGPMKKSKKKTARIRPRGVESLKSSLREGKVNGKKKQLGGTGKGKLLG